MTSNADTSGMYEFNDIQVDVDGLKVTKAGAEIPLEPKAHSLLRVLLSRPGHAFTHNELLDAVWGHRHVTPGVLVRLVGILRRALGEEDTHERYIQTIHGVGYRFNLPVHAGSLAIPGNDLTPLHPADVSQPIKRVHETPASVPYENTDDTISSLHQPASVRRYNKQFLQLAVLCLMLASLATLLYFQRTTESAPISDAADNPPIIAVMPLRALDKDQRSIALAESISENISSLLSRTPGVRVTAPASSALPAISTNDDGANPLPATHYLEGTLQHEQQRVFVSLRLVTKETRRTVWSQSFERQSDPGFMLQRQIANTASRNLIKAMQITNIPEGENPQRYKRYYWAQQRVVDSTRANNVEFQDAERELHQLTREFPDYARAWSGLAMIHLIASSNIDKDRMKNREQAILAANKALSLDPEQADAISVLASIACRDQDWEKCFSLSEKSVELDPNNSLVLGLHAQRLITLGYIKQGMKAIDDSLALDPLSTPSSFSRGRALDTLGRHQEARDQFLSNDRPAQGATALFMNAMWRQDYEDAKKIAGELPLDYRWRDSEITLAAAMTDASLWPELLRNLEKTEAIVDSANPFRPLSLERLFLPQRDYAHDIAGLDTMQVMSYTSYQWILWQPQSRELRASDAFRQYIERTGLKAFWKKHKQPDFCTIDKVKEPNCE